MNKPVDQMDQMELLLVVMQQREQIKNLEQQVNSLHWLAEPDRMGGQFTQEEYHRRDRL